MSRSRPYDTTRITWDNMLSKSLEIPMNQREYSWEKEDIDKFLKDIFFIFEENKYIEKMGSIISLNYNGKIHIYDGQQRIITIILLLKSISCLSTKENLKYKINNLLTIDKEIDFDIDNNINITNYSNCSIIPKIKCVNPYDMRALVDIFNDNIKSYNDYIKKLDNNNDNDDEIDYDCKICNKKFLSKNNFIKHLEKKHNYTHNNNSKIYSAYIQIYNYLYKIKYDDKKLISLYKFITENIDIQYYEFNDPIYASRIFDWENNRGRNVEQLDLIKNHIMVKIIDDKKTEIYDKWEKLKQIKNNIYLNNYSQEIFEVAIKLYNKKITSKSNYEELFEKIINHQDTYIELHKFFKIVENLYDIMDKIAETKFGRLINSSSNIRLNFIIYSLFLLPVFYITGKINNDLIKLLTKWHFRNLEFKNRNFNHLCYLQQLENITNNVLNNIEYDYYTAFENLLKKNIDESVYGNNFVHGIKNKSLKSIKATYTLLFLETCINTDDHIVNLNLSLEHIYPQKNKNKLNNDKLMNNIGNLTLIERKNSENGHKGNSSLGCKPFSDKIKSYQTSCAKITRDIILKYKFTKFDDENDIEERSDLIAKLLNKYTLY